MKFNVGYEGKYVFGCVGRYGKEKRIMYLRIDGRTLELLSAVDFEYGVWDVKNLDEFQTHIYEMAKKYVERDKAGLMV